MTDAQADSQIHRDYMENRILSAPPVEIVQMLYQVAIDNLNTAIAYLKTGDNLGRSRAVTKAQQAVDELLFALDHAAGASFSRNLADLYNYVRREIIAGHTRRSERAFRNALGVLTILSEGWSEVRTRVLGEHATPEEQPSEAARVTQISQLYSDPARDPATPRDWSC
jgi:flagellar secretion chaperone FliS